MNNLTAVKVNSKIIWLLTIGALAVLGYFIYQGFFNETEIKLDPSNNTFVSATKQAKYVDILNKENLSFQNTVNPDMLSNTENFTVSVDLSNSIGRDNPFIP